MTNEDAPGDASADQLRVLYELTRRLATFVDLDDVVCFATKRARELFDAEGCALILLDRRRNEFTFPISSQRESGTAGEDRLAEIRFPADRGIAGWVVAHDEAALVEDTANDPRFYAGVDRETALETRSLLCAPLRSGGQSIGVHAARPHFLQQVFAAKVSSLGQGLKKMLRLNELAPRGHGFLHRDAP